MSKLPRCEGEAYGTEAHRAPHLYKYRSKQPSHTAYAGGSFFPRPIAMSLAPEKRRLREAAIAARKGLSPEARAAASRDIAARLAELDLFRRARTVALYASLGSEVDTAAVARLAAAAGKRLAWPRAGPPGRPLELAACAPEELRPGAHGVREPPPSAPAVGPGEVDCAVVPGLAFDARGGRLGRGGGHYDATLAALPARAARIGLSFEVQVVAEVPREPHDALLDAVVTERRVLRASRPGAPRLEPPAG